MNMVRGWGLARTAALLVSAYGWMVVAPSRAILAQRSGGQTQVPSNPLGDPQPSSLPGLGSGGADDVMRSRTAKMERDQEKARQDERQRKLVADTQRLLALATELKTEVDKTDKDTLSMDVIRKAEEIEKLAKSVKDRMRGS